MDLHTASRRLALLASLSLAASTLDLEFWKSGYGPVLYHLTCTP
jgi:hypothetical protein